MANATVSRLGAADGTTGTYAQDNTLFLKVFSGEVLTSFAQQTVMMNRHMVRTISSGKSAQFPVTGRTSAAYHTPGVEITGTAIEHNEYVITIDDMLLSSVFVANIDEAKNHYDVRSIYAREMGIALANQMDKHVMQQFLIGATTSTAKPDSETDKVGTVIDRTDAGLTTPASDSFLGQANGANLVKAIFAAAEALDEKNVPSEGRFCIVKPQEYYALANLSDIVSADFARRNVGGRETGQVFMIAGMEIVKSNNLPTTDIDAGSGAPPVTGDAEERHAIDASSTAAIVAHPSGVGTVKLMDLSTEMEYDIRRQGTLMVAKYAMGHGILRPESCVQIKDVQGS
jgi:hypothetical protein